MRIQNAEGSPDRRRAAGTTLVEVLVVMVIFLVGMLAMMQVFPGGLRIMRDNRNKTQGTNLARQYMEWYKGRSDVMPEMILPVYPMSTALGVALVADAARKPGELGPPAATALDANGDFLDSSNNVLGTWQSLSGANAVRMVIGEGGVIPAPRAVGSAYGALLVLQFAPVDNPTAVGFFEVYGNDMLLKGGTPTGGVVRPYEFYVANLMSPTASVLLPTDPTLTRSFRISFAGTVSGGVTRQIVTTTPITVPPDPTGKYFEVDLAPLICSGAETLSSVDGDSIKVAQMFRDVTTGSFSGDPYEYQLLDPTLGVVLFNPVGYRYKVRQDQGASVPLVGRVNYNVLDWRILHEDFRVPGTDHAFYQLAIPGLAVKGNQGADGRPNPGFPPTGSAPYAGSDFILVDLDTGGTYLPTSYHVDKSLGVVTFLDQDPATDGIQVDLLYPGATTPVRVSATGRSVRALYQGTGEWSVQVMKPASVYLLSSTVPGVGQYTFPIPGNKIYFPWCDLGKKVTVGLPSYSGLDSNLQADNQDFVIQAHPSDAYPSIIAPNGFGAGTPLTVKGASVSVRVLWNPEFFTLTSDPAENMRRFNLWMASWRRTETQTFLQRSEN